MYCISAFRFNPFTETHIRIKQSQREGRKETSKKGTTHTHTHAQTQVFEWWVVWIAMCEWLWCVLFGHLEDEYFQSRRTEHSESSIW
jgi:hypothetical protein